MKHLFKTALLAAALVASTGAQAADKLFIYVSPDPIGVNKFLELGEIGINAAGEKFGAEVKTYESDTPQSRIENVNAAVNEGADIVIVLGFEFNDLIAEVAPTAPDTQFLIVDQCIFEDRPENVHCAVFREYEAAFLAGVAAAMNSTSGKIGVIGALDIPFLHRFTDGYAMGAKHVNPEINVETRWVGGENPFSDPVRAKEQALALTAAGADVIFTATSGGDYGVFEAAQENVFKILSVDVNQCPSAPGHVIDNTLKGVDQALLLSVEAILNGEVSTVASYGLAEGGMTLAALQDGLAETGCLIADQSETIAKVKEVADLIISGELKIEDPMFAQ